MTRASLWGMALCGSLVGAGLALVLTSSPGGEHGSAEGPAALKPSSVVAAGVPKSHFRAHVRPIGAWDADTPFDVAAAWRRARALSGLSSLQLEGRLTRVLRSGHEFESELKLGYEQIGEREVMTLTLPRESGGSQKYRAELRDGVITEVRVESEGADGEPQLAEIPAAVLDQVEGGGLPIGIGDLLVRDAVVLLRALRGGQWSVLGDLGAIGSRRLIVFEVDLEREHQPSNGTPNASVQAASALAYVDAERLELRSLRVFDRRDRLVRDYGDFVYQQSVGGRALSGFRVSTIPSGSHTVFRLEITQLGD